MLSVWRKRRSTLRWGWREGRADLYGPFRQLTAGRIVRRLGRAGVEYHPPVCRNCEAVLDLSVRNPVQSVKYQHVPCPNCGTICIMEGPEADGAYSREPMWLPR